MVYDNRAYQGNGGAVYIRSYRATNSWSFISRCQFIDNTAGQGSGGAIFDSTDRNIINSFIVIQCQFINNTVSISGGAIYKMEEIGI